MKRAMGGKTAGSRRDVWLLISIVILCLYALFLIYPLFMVLRNAVVSESGAFTLSHFVKFFSKRYYISTMANSFALSVSVTAFRCSSACRWPIFIICTRSRARGFCRSSLFCAACRRRLWARIPGFCCWGATG